MVVRHAVERDARTRLIEHRITGRGPTVARLADRADQREPAAVACDTDGACRYRPMLLRALLHFGEEHLLVHMAAERVDRFARTNAFQRCGRAVDIGPALRI